MSTYCVDVPVGGFFQRHWRVNDNWYSALYERVTDIYMTCRIDALGSANGDWIGYSTTDWGRANEARIEIIAPGVIDQIMMLAHHRAYRRIAALMGTQWMPAKLYENAWLHGLT